MKVSLIILVSLCAFAASSDVIKSHYSPEYIKGLWEDWKEEQNWDCGTESEEECFAEEEKRFNIFLENLQKVEICNQDPNTTHTCGLGPFAHLTVEEFLEQYTGHTFPEINNDDRLLSEEAPRGLSTTCTSVDWVAQGKVSAVKNQGQCGSCWAFSTTGALEACQALADCTSPVSLSEEQLVECSQSLGNLACNGGSFYYGFEYAYLNGMEEEDSYPYTSGNDNVGSCSYDDSKTVQTPTNWQYKYRSNEDYLKQNLCNHPVSVSVDATTLQTYKSGIISTCSYSELDHAVLAVGFDDNDGTDGSITVKNSWGTTWGESGYFRVSQKDNTGNGYGQCGIYQEHSYPICASSSNSKC